MTEADAPQVPRWRGLKRFMPKRPQNGANWREIVSNLGELAAIGAISHGFWLITAAAGWISAGVGLAAVSVAISVGGSG